jgi:sterol 24-C-methyltransferase
MKSGGDVQVSSNSGKRFALLESDQVGPTVGRYADEFDKRADERAGEASGISKDFYNLVTHFYEYGWGESFHFATPHKGETRKESITRHDHYLALRLGLRPGMKVLDMGCGVGGPMRNIARVSGADITGVTISPHQIERGRRYNERDGLSDICHFVEGDFNARLPFADNSFDAAYSIDAICHAADRKLPFGEVFRLLKPGGLFTGSDWVMTGAYRPGDPEHERIKHGIELGSGVSRLAAFDDIGRALRAVGFEVIEERDLVDPAAPWHKELGAPAGVQGFLSSRAGTYMTHQLCRALETLHLSPAGTVRVHEILRTAQSSLVDGGRTGIFTPLLFWLARKPG